MKKKMRKLLSLLVSLTMMASGFTMTVHAESAGVDGEDNVAVADAADAARGGGTNSLSDLDVDFAGQDGQQENLSEENKASEDTESGDGTGQTGEEQTSENNGQPGGENQNTSADEEITGEGGEDAEEGEADDGIKTADLEGDNTDGETGEKKVGTYDELKAAIEAAGTAPTTITIAESFDLTGYLQVKEGQDITLIAKDGVVLGRSESAKGNLWVNGQLTLENVVLDGQNIPTGYALLHITSTGTVTMNDGTVIQNSYNNYSAKQYGGGVYNAGTLIMNGGSITGNTADNYGGGVCNYGTFTMNGGTISGNENPTWYGGGVYNKGTFTANGGSITGNTANNYGGGVYNANTFKFTGGKICGNETTNAWYGNGGGVYNAKSFEMTGGEISGNKVTGNTYYEVIYGAGGGVYNAGTLTTSGGTISKNIAENLGGGVYSATGITMTDTTISGNVNGGVYTDATVGAGAVTLKSLTVTGNTGSQPALRIGVVDGALVEGCTITENEVLGAAVEITGRGPTVSDDATKFKDTEKILKDCVITDNVCTSTDYLSQKATVSLGSYGRKVVSNCTITGNHAYYGGLLNQTTNALTTICDGTLIANNTGDMSGGLATQTASNDKDAVTVIDGAVIKNNTGGSVGGVNANGNFEFKSGAIYNNTAQNDPKANDLNKYNASAKCTLIKASEMVDPQVESDDFFQDYIWSDGVDRWEDLSFTNTKEPFSLTAAPKKAFFENVVYLNGVTGSKDNDGFSVDKPVKTLEQALEQLKKLPESEEDPVICVTGTLTSTETETWDGEGVTLMRYPTFKLALIDVKGGQLTLTNITLDGAYALGLVESSAPLVKLSGGELVLDEGATLQNNVRTGGNKYEGGGGVYANGGTLTMKDGSVIQDNYAHNGGGVSLMQNNPVFNMEGGIIRNNRTSVNGKYSSGTAFNTSGGGVFIAYDSVMNMSGGTISENTAYSGAGISLGGPENDVFFKNSHPTFNMTGGSIEGNTAYSSGGGLFVQMNCTATIRSGSISYNHTRALGLGANFGGGGVYVNGGKSSTLKNGVLQLYNVEITQNKAKQESGFGAVIAGCPTSDTRIYATDGGVIYENSGKNDIYLMSGNLSGSYSGTAQLYLSPVMLGGGAYHWIDMDGAELSLNNGFIQVFNEIFTTKTAVTREEVTGLDQIKTRIIGNTSDNNGAAIGSNGDVIIGTAPTETTELSVEKTWLDAGYEDQRPQSIQVRVYAQVGDAEAVDIGFMELDAQNGWKAVLKKLPAKDANGELITYSVKEVKVPNYESTVSGSMADGFTLTNTYVPPEETIDLTVNKVWANDTEANRPASIQVQLFRNGVADGAPVTLNSPGWTYTWEGLPAGEGITYSVEEVQVPDGYRANVEIIDGVFIITNTYTPPETPPDEPEYPPYYPDEPDEEVPEDEVPLTPPEEEVPEEEVPLAPPEEEIPEEDIPLVDAPKTGSSRRGLFSFFLLLGTGLALLAGKKRKDDNI